MILFLYKNSSLQNFFQNFTNFIKNFIKPKVKFTQNFIKIFSTFSNLCFFKFWENLLKILTNYLEIEFVNKKIIPLMHYPNPTPFIQPSLLLEIVCQTVSGVFTIRADLTCPHFSKLCGFSNFPSWPHWGIIRFRQLGKGATRCSCVPEGYVVSLSANSPTMLQPSEDYVDGGKAIFLNL